MSPYDTAIVEVKESPMAGAGERTWRDLAAEDPDGLGTDLTIGEMLWGRDGLNEIPAILPLADEDREVLLDGDE